MKNKFFKILALMVSASTFGQVGINTDSPNPNALLELYSANKGLLLPQLNLQEKNLPNPLSQHIAGILIYNNQVSGTGSNAVNQGLYYNDGTSWVPMSVENKKIGDVKYSFQSTDHNGWYLLDGRNINDLTSIAKASAVALGYNSFLPNIKNRFLKTKLNTENVGITGGGSVVLTRENLPNINFTGTTNTSGAHTHTYTDNTASTGSSASGNNNPISNSGNGDYSTYSAGYHNHTVSIPSGGSDSPINYSPPYLSSNMFIYLGN